MLQKGSSSAAVEHQENSGEPKRSEDGGLELGSESRSVKSNVKSENTAKIPVPCSRADDNGSSGNDEDTAASEFKATANALELFAGHGSPKITF